MARGAVGGLLRNRVLDVQRRPQAGVGVLARAVDDRRRRRLIFVRDPPAQVEAAIAHLSKEADLVVRRTASTVFLSTALMQNGRLDGLIVLFTQIQMVGRIARIYVQRPSPRELVRLYANVGSTAFVASGLESLDLGEMVAPLAVSVVPALKSGIPGRDSGPGPKSPTDGS